MYLQHFGLKEFPFDITPDTSYFFSSSGSQQALNTLVFAARAGEGFIKITGEVGTGKTLLCRKIMANLKQDFQVAYIPTPNLDPVALFIEMAVEFGIALPPSEELNQHQVLKLLTGRLLEFIREGKRAVICLDEAQAMPIETLEALRLLTNLETEKRKLLQVIIFGQPELDEKLDHPSIRQLKQRIAFDYHLPALSREELGLYVDHRLMVAGYQGSRMFSRTALWMLHRKTNRVPRLVNIIAHKSILSAFGKGRKFVNVFDVLAASNDTSSLRKPRWVRGGYILLLFIISCSIIGIGWVYLS